MDDDNELTNEYTETNAIHTQGQDKTNTEPENLNTKTEEGRDVRLFTKYGWSNKL